MLVEPGRCPANYTDEQIKTLAALPALVCSETIATRRLESGPLRPWQISFDGYQALIGRLKAAGGEAQMFNTGPRHPRQQSHDHARQEQPTDRLYDPAVDRRAGQQPQGGEMRTRVIAIGALFAGALVV